MSESATSVAAVDPNAKLTELFNNWVKGQQEIADRLSKGAPDPAAAPAAAPEPDPLGFTAEEKFNFLVDALLASGNLSEYSSQQLRKLRPLPEDVLKAHEFQAKSRPR